jgi:hypothetical protein
MDPVAASFSARVDLPCRVFCGPGGAVVLSGTALSIATSRMVVALEEGNGGPPDVGEQVRLELLLPANGNAANERYLAVRARVLDVVETAQGSRRLTITFRKPSFKAGVEAARRKPVRAEVKRWSM